MTTKPLIVYVVTCSHHPIYGAFAERKTADLMCAGCCPDAEVVEYVPK